jgi:hypothetical protein
LILMKRIRRLGSPLERIHAHKAAPPRLVPARAQIDIAARSLQLAGEPEAPRLRLAWRAPRVVLRRTAGSLLDCSRAGVWCSMPLHGGWVRRSLS